MDLVPAPNGETSSLKSEVEAAHTSHTMAAGGEVVECNGDANGTGNGTVNPTNVVDLVEEASHSEHEADSDDSEDPWETQSLYEDTLQIVRDEQLRDGGGMAPNLVLCIFYGYVLIGILWF